MSIFKQVGAAGGAAVIAVTFIHPIDVVKTRMQASGEKGRTGVRDYGKLGMGGTVKVIAKEEGITAFWKGIPACVPPPPPPPPRLSSTPLAPRRAAPCRTALAL